MNISASTQWSFRPAQMPEFWGQARMPMNLFYSATSALSAVQKIFCQKMARFDGLMISGIRWHSGQANITKAKELEQLKKKPGLPQFYIG